MALFPAYAPDDPSPSSNVEEGEPSWTRNSSFIGFKKTVVHSSPSESEPSTPGSSESDLEEDSGHSKDAGHSKRRLSPPSPEIRKKHKSKKSSKKDVDYELLLGLDKLCFIDVTPSKHNVVQMHSKSKKKKKKKNAVSKDRYFSCFKGETCPDKFLTTGEDLLNKTGEFNKLLREEPSNVEMWLKYVKFQDSVIGESKSRAEKKLAILEKAIDANPGSVELYEEMFLIMDCVFSNDVVAAEAKKLVSKDSKNTVGWKWLINVSLFNVAKLSSPKVIKSFSSALDGLFRAYPNNSKPLLDVLLQCFTFLRQAGLWEQLWTLVQLCLELNLSTPGSNAFKVTTVIPEQKIKEMEDTIVTCGLPLGSLWLRVEYLRECSHFLPFPECQDDPQRIVYPSDVDDLLHPVHSTHTPRLISIILTALKVPLIPFTHCGALFIGLDKVPWAVESPEFILNALSHPYLISQVNTNCLEVSKELLVSPQYLVEDKVGCSEYFDSVSSTFESIIRHTSDETQTLCAVWLMRWFRFVGRKSLTSKAKNLLKDHRNCIPLYTEFALFSLHVGDTATCLKVLETAVSLSTSPLSVASKTEKVYLTYLYKTYIEVLMKINSKLHRSKILSLLLTVSLNKKISEPTPESIALAGDRFSHLTKEIVIDALSSASDDVTFRDVILPPFEVSWMSCHIAFLSMTKTPWDSINYLQSSIDELLPNVKATLAVGTCILEGWYELLIHVMHIAHSPSYHDCYPVLSKALRSASELFPNNLYVLHIASVIDIIIGKWWSVSPVFFNKSIFMKLFTILVFREKMLLFDEKNSGDARENSQRRLYGLVKNAVFDSEPNDNNDSVKRCPLIWRLLLQFVASQHPAEIKATFYKAVDMCPWVKSIYYDAVKILPEELGQIQDLLIEKELRIHITTEELEILRQGPDLPLTSS